MKLIRRDIIYLICLIISDSVPFVVFLIYVIAYGVLGEDPHNIQAYSQSLGFLDMFWPCLSAQLSASLAVYRLAFLNEVFLNLIIIVSPYLSSLIIIILLSMTAYYSEFYKPKYAFISQPYPNTSTISSATFHYLFIHLFVCYSIVLISYICVLKYTDKAGKSIKLRNTEEMCTEAAIQRKQVKRVTIRGWLFIIASAVVYMPGIFFLLIEGHLSTSSSISTKVKLILSSLKVFLIVCGGLIDSLLVLFFHTGINRQFKILMGYN
ncbi:hypothetical protein K502DRAFT_322469, partial [Neoconidiobolus thromboides FSU 785]